MRRLALAAAIGIVATSVGYAQTGVRILKVRGDVSMIQTPGGNITVLAFPQGVTLVDSGRAEDADQVLSAIRTLSKQPIRYIINTSVDPGHSGGNAKLGPDGIYAACAGSVWKLTELQLEGKKRLGAGAFLAGNRLQAGDRLGT